METSDHIENRLRLALHPKRFPESSETWDRIERRLVRTSPCPPRWYWMFALTALVLLTVTTSIVLATSTAAQAQLRALTGIAVSNNRLEGVSPRTPLAVFQPTYLPSGTTLVTTAYSAGSAGNAPLEPSVNSTLSRAGGREITPDVVATATRRGNLYLSNANGPIVVLIFADETKRYIEITQQPAAGKSLPKGDSIMIRRASGVRFQDDGREVIAWVEQGTLIQIATTIARPEAVRVAESLQQTPIAMVQSTISATPPAWVAVPLARRVQAVRKVAVDRSEVIRACGMWDPSNHGITGYEQVLCAARIVSGDQSGNFGVDRYPWEQAATRLGIDTSIAPPGNPLVYLVQINVSDRGGSVVVLDALNGDPYLLVTLAALP